MITRKVVMSLTLRQEELIQVEKYECATDLSNNQSMSTPIFDCRVSLLLGDLQGGETTFLSLNLELSLDRRLMLVQSALNHDASKQSNSRIC